MDAFQRSVFIDFKKDLPPFDIVAAAVTSNFGLNCASSLVPSDEGGYFLTFANVADVVGAIDSGLEIDGSLFEISGVSARTVTVSFFDLPEFVTDNAVLAKLGSIGCEIRGPIVWRKKRDFYCGVRTVRVTLPEGISSLPYRLKLVDAVGREKFYAVKHESQLKVCNKCYSTEHLYRQCPDFKCHRCQKQGHVIRQCTWQPDECENEVEVSLSEQAGEAMAVDGAVVGTQEAAPVCVSQVRGHSRSRSRSATRRGAKHTLSSSRDGALSLRPASHSVALSTKALKVTPQPVMHPFTRHDQPKPEWWPIEVPWPPTTDNEYIARLCRYRGRKIASEKYKDYVLPDNYGFPTKNDGSTAQ